MDLLPRLAIIGGDDYELAAGSVLFATGVATISDDNDNLYWDNINKRLGLGCNDPATLLELSTDSANTELIISTFHDTEATTPRLIMRKADNTRASPALVDDNAVLGTLSFQGYDGSGWHEGARIEARIAGTPSDGTDMPTELAFWTTPEASGSPTERMTIGPTGLVTVKYDLTVGSLRFDGLNHYIGITGDLDLMALTADLLTINGGITVTAGLIADAGTLVMDAANHRVGIPYLAAGLSGIATSPVTIRQPADR